MWLMNLSGRLDGVNRQGPLSPVPRGCYGVGSRRYPHAGFTVASKLAWRGRLAAEPLDIGPERSFQADHCIHHRWVSIWPPAHIAPTACIDDLADPAGPLRIQALPFELAAECLLDFRLLLMQAIEDGFVFGIGVLASIDIELRSRFRLPDDVVVGEAAAPGPRSDPAVSAGRDACMQARLASRILKQTAPKRLARLVALRELVLGLPDRFCRLGRPPR